MPRCREGLDDRAWQWQGLLTGNADAREAWDRGARTVDDTLTRWVVSLGGALDEHVNPVERGAPWCDGDNTNELDQPEVIMSTRNYRTPDEEEGSYADSELPVDATIPKDDDRVDDDRVDNDRVDNDRFDDGKSGFENAADDVVGKAKEGLGKVTSNERHAAAAPRCDRRTDHRGFCDRRRPGLTAAPTTAALATGDGPGGDRCGDDRGLGDGGADDADPSDSCWSSGMSGSCRSSSSSASMRGDDRLDGDAAVGDQLAAGAAGGGRERRRPEVLVDEHAGDASGVHRGGEVHDVVRGEQFGELGLELDQWAESPRSESSIASTLPSASFARMISVDHPDRAGVGQPHQLLGDLAGEVLVPSGNSTTR